MGICTCVQGDMQEANCDDSTNAHVKESIAALEKLSIILHIRAISLYFPRTH